MTMLPRAAELYLDELSQLLAPVEPVDRIEIVAGIREHIEAQLLAMPGEPSDAEVTTILRGLGSPDAVARQAVPDTRPAESRDARPATPVGPVATAGATPVPVLERRWVGALVPTLLAFPLLTLSAGSLALVGGDLQGPQFTEGVVLTVMLWWMWIPAIVLIWISPGWTLRWKIAGTTLLAWPLLLSAATDAIELPALGFALGVVASATALVMLGRRFRRPVTATSRPT